MPARGCRLATRLRSVADTVSLIALAGVSTDGGVIMGLYRKNAWQERVQHGKTREADSLGRYPRSRALTRNPKSQMVLALLLDCA